MSRLCANLAGCLGAAVRSWAFPPGGGRFALEAPFEVQRRGEAEAGDAGSRRRDASSDASSSTRGDATAEGVRTE